MIAEAVRTTLGPRGMDKLIVDGRGKSAEFLRPVAEEEAPPECLGLAEVGIRNLSALKISEGLLTVKQFLFRHCPEC